MGAISLKCRQTVTFFIYGMICLKDIQCQHYNAVYFDSTREILQLYNLLFIVIIAVLWQIATRF